MSIEQITSFLTNNILGLIILSVMSSLLASFFYGRLKKVFMLFVKKYRKRNFIKYLTKTAISFVYGYRFAYASKGTHFQQIVLIGDYIVDIIILVGKIIFTLLVSIILLLVVNSIFSWVIVVITSFIVTLQYKKLKVILLHYNQGLEMIFGEEALKQEKEGYIQYWDRLTKKQEENNEE